MKSNLLFPQIVFGLLGLMPSLAIGQATGKSAAPKEKTQVYGAISIGYGNTFLRGALGDKETINDERGFGRNDGMSISTYYYWAPQKFRGLGLGTGLKGFIARPNEGEDNETYTYDYYSLALGVKDFFVSKEFNRGISINANIGYGISMERTEFGNTNTINLQIARGLSYGGGIGYAIAIAGNGMAINIDLDYEYANRQADISGVTAEDDFINHNVAAKIGLIF